MRTMTVILMTVLFIGCDPSKPTAPSGKSASQVGNINDNGNQMRGPGPGGTSFGIPNTLSGKLSDEQEQMVPEDLRGAFLIEALLPITTKELVKVLQFKTQVAEETRDGKHYVALQDFRHVQFSDELSGHMIVIERYIITPD